MRTLPTSVSTVPVLATLLVLTAWLYFFSIIMLVGAKDLVAIGAINEAKAEGRRLGQRQKRRFHSTRCSESSAPQRMRHSRREASSSKEWNMH